MKNTFLVLLFSCFFAFLLRGQNTPLNKVTAFHQKNKYALLNEYAQFLSLPNTMNDTASLADNARFIADMMKKRGIENVQLLHGTSKGTIPAVFGEVKVPNATTTLVFYAHYDGQPVNPEKWAEGLSPFKPQMTTNSLDKGGKFIDFPTQNTPLSMDYRIYGRSSSDDKAGVFAIINAYDALRQNGLTPSVNVKFLFEGEEEKGSTHLNEILDKNKTLLKADMWIIADGPLHASGRKQIVFGVRGDVNMNVTVYGAKRPLHSGNYGNWAPNPAWKLTRLLATMKDDNGRVLIDGFYDDVTPLSKLEREALAAIPDPAPMMQKELAFAQAESTERTFLESITTLPTLNINGIVSANVGKLASNIIPIMATVTLDLRLVKGNNWEKQVQKVIKHIKKQGFEVFDREPTNEERLKFPNIATVKVGTGYNAQRTSMDLPLAQRVIKAVQNSTKESVILMPSAGGSLPLYLFEEVLNTPPLTVPVVNYDNNQHGENENLRIGCLFDGIETMAAIMLLPTK
ncbi:MAG: M20/M25/M40 family metallo-hydrolase [Saprospiraceae bacterium]|nr:M20/M25/M40 family metallo-hydrolase [Saprospiraceae bacterium]